MNLVRPNRPHISHLGCFSSIRLILNLWEHLNWLYYFTNSAEYTSHRDFTRSVTFLWMLNSLSRGSLISDTRTIWTLRIYVIKLYCPLCQHSIVAYLARKNCKARSLPQGRTVHQYPYVIRRWGNWAHYCMIMMGRRRRREIAGYIEEISQILNYSLNVMFAWGMVKGVCFAFTVRVILFKCYAVIAWHKNKIKHEQRVIRWEHYLLNKLQVDLSLSGFPGLG